MNLAPVLAAPSLVQAHLALALLSLICGTGVLFAKKGTLFHRRLGAFFVAAMLAVAATSFWISGVVPGHYSPIHILSIVTLVTLVTLPIAVWHRRRDDTAEDSLNGSLFGAPPAPE